MEHAGRGRWRLVGMALAVTAALTGCTIPIVNVEVPFDLPELPFELPGIELPGIDLEELPVPEVTLPIGIRTSVDDARLEVLGSNVSTLSDEALVLPGYLTVGLKTAASTAPLCVEGEFGSVYGLDVDIAAAVASEMGLLVRYVPVTDASSLGTECDVIMNGRSGNPADITIAGTYVENAISFFHRGETVVSAPTDLGGKSVGVQSGSTSELALNGTALKMSQKNYDNLNDTFDGLAAGEVDYVLCEAYPGAYLASLHEGITFAGSLEAPETAGIAVRTENAELAEAVRAAFETISSDGTLEVARTRWVGQMPTLTTDSQIQNVPMPAAPAPSVDTSDGEDNDGSDAGGGAITNI